MEKLVKKGAEADLYITEWFSLKVLSKIRLTKPYRVPQLDKQIRKHRTLSEANFLHYSKMFGIFTPTVYFVDPVRSEIIMEYIHGERLREILIHKRSRAVGKTCLELGKIIGKLHKANLIHGDITTSNVIVTQDNKLVLLDFGLSFRSNRVEDRAVDLHLIKQILKAAHTNLWNTAYDAIVEGYASIIGREPTKLVLRRIGEIEKRGRYARVE